MFKKSTDDRLSSWAEFRITLNTAANPFEAVWQFWKDAPYVPYNNRIDPFHQRSWPTPWEIIVHNLYDDFTKAIMIGYTLKFTDRFKNSRIEVRTLLDKDRNAAYNVVFVDDITAINYNDNGPVSVDSLPDNFFVENVIELTGTR